MKRYTFDTFEVDESNREAYAVCRAVAELQTVAPLPVVLVGDEGRGKTHLVYSIVNHVRAGSAKTGLACVTARQFPETVRALIADPSPVARATSAILLVDQLEEFQEFVEELEAVIRIFLDNEQPVVLASNVHPARLKNLPEGLRALLEKGQTIGVRPRLIHEAAESKPLSDELFRKQQEEIRRLRDDLAKAEEKAAVAAEVVEVRRQLEAERRRTVDLEERVESEKQGQETLHRELDDARTQVQLLRRELDREQTEVAALSRLHEDVARLEEQLARAQAERDSADRERTALATQLVERAALEEEAQHLRLQLHSTQEQREHAEQATTQLVQRTQAILAQVEANRARFADTERGYVEQIRRLEALVAQQVAAAPGDDSDRAAAMQVEFANMRKDLDTQLAAARAEARHAGKAREDALDKLDQLTAKHAALELELEKIRDESELRAAELEALRHEAAGQVAGANAQAGDVLRECSRLGAALDFSRQTGQDVANEIQQVQAQIVTSVEALAALATRLLNATEVTTDHSRDSSAANDREIPDTEPAPISGDAIADLLAGAKQANLIGPAPEDA